MLSVVCCCCCPLQPISEIFTNSYNFVCTTGSTPNYEYYVYAYPYGMTNVFLPSDRFAYFNNVQSAVDYIETSNCYGNFYAYVSSAIATFVSKYGFRETEYYDFYVDGVLYQRIVSYEFLSADLKKFSNSVIYLVLSFNKITNYEKKYA
jgi:hypothetical protein